jgi:hypothetical protein
MLSSPELCYNCPNQPRTQEMYINVHEIPWPPRQKNVNKMKPTNPNAHTYVNGTDVKTHGYAVTHNTFLQ